MRDYTYFRCALLPALLALSLSVHANITFRVFTGGPQAGEVHIDSPEGHYIYFRADFRNDEAPGGFCGIRWSAPDAGELAWYWGNPGRMAMPSNGAPTRELSYTSRYSSCSEELSHSLFHTPSTPALHITVAQPLAEAAAVLADRSVQAGQAAQPDPHRAAGQAARLEPAQMLPQLVQQDRHAPADEALGRHGALSRLQALPDDQQRLLHAVLGQVLQLGAAGHAAPGHRVQEPAQLLERRFALRQARGLAAGEELG